MSFELTKSNIKVAKNNDVDVITKDYVLSNATIYSNTLKGGIPEWLDTAITAAISNGTVSLSEAIADLNSTIDALQTGISQSIQSIQSDVESTNTLITTVKSELNDNIAAVADIANSKVTESEARSISEQIVGSKFRVGNEDEAEAWATSLTESYASQNLAYAQTVDNIIAVQNDQQITLSDVNKVIAGQFQFWGGEDPITVGCIIYTTDDNVPDWGNNTTTDSYLDNGDGTTSPYQLWQYLGKGLGSSTNNWRKIDNINGTLGVAKSLATDGDGNITGWAYASGSGGESEFAIHADHFYISNSDNSARPFNIDSDGIHFVGKVTFSSITDRQEYIVDPINDLQDNKATVFRTSTEPTVNDNNLSVNDLWIPPSDVDDYKANEIYQCTDIDPVTFVNLTTINEAISNVQVNLQNQVDSKIDMYYQDNPPYDNASEENALNDSRVGDYWYCGATSDDYTKGIVYKYTKNNSDYTWEVSQDVSHEVFDIADSKRTIYSNATDDTPNGEVNDLWIPLSGDTVTLDGVDIIKTKVYIFSPDSKWIVATDYTNNDYAESIVNGNTQIDLAQHLDSLGWEQRISDSEDALSTHTAEIAGLEETNDGVVNSFYQTTAPDSDVSSYGDWWVDTDASPLKAYRYEDSDGKNVNTLDWRDNSDSILGRAYISAQNAQATADGKIVSFFQNDVPTAEGVGDLWVDTDDNNKTYRAASIGANEIKSGEWEPITDSSALNNFISTTYTNDQINIGNQLDNKAEAYFQNTEPYAASDGQPSQDADTWYNSDNGELKVFRYDADNPEWVLITDPKAISAYQAAQNAQATADGKIVSYTGSSEPTNYSVGDVWLQGSSGDIYVCQTAHDTFRSSDWLIASKYTDDTTALNAQNLANVALQQLPTIAIKANANANNLDAANGECAIFGYNSNGEISHSNISILFNGQRVNLEVQPNRDLFVNTIDTFGYILYIRDKDVLKYKDGDNLADGDRNFWVVTYDKVRGWLYDNNSYLAPCSDYVDFSTLTEGYDYMLVGDIRTGYLANQAQVDAYIDGGGDDSVKVGDYVNDWTTEANVYQEAITFDSVENHFDKMEILKNGGVDSLFSRAWKDPFNEDSWTVTDNNEGTIAIQKGYNVSVSSDDQDSHDSWAISTKKFKYDPNSLYKITFKGYTETDGTHNFYAGVMGFAADGTTKVNVAGSDASDNQHYIAAHSEDLVDGQHFEFTGYFKGIGTSDDYHYDTDILYPSPLNSAVVYFSPMVVAGYDADVNQTTYLTDVQVEIVSTATIQHAYSNSPKLDIKINHENYTDSGTGEAYIYGISEVGRPIETGSGGYVLYSNEKLYISNQKMYTNLKNKNGYICFRRSGFPNVADKTVQIVFAYPKSNTVSQWYYDANSDTPVLFDFTDADFSDIYVIGEMVTCETSNDCIKSASIWLQAKKIEEIHRIAKQFSTGTTEINGDVITTGTIKSDKMAVGQSIVSANFNPHSSDDVSDTPTEADYYDAIDDSVTPAGFRLKAGATGTYSDPNIYGGAIRGSKIYSSLFMNINTYDKPYLKNFSGHIHPGAFDGDAITSLTINTYIVDADQNGDIENGISPTYSSNTGKCEIITNAPWYYSYNIVKGRTAIDNDQNCEVKIQLFRYENIDNTGDINVVATYTYKHNIGDDTIDQYFTMTNLNIVFRIIIYYDSGADSVMYYLYYINSGMMYGMAGNDSKYQGAYQIFISAHFTDSDGNDLDDGDTNNFISNRYTIVTNP